MTSQTTLLVLAVVLSSILLFAAAAVDTDEEWEQDLLWPEGTDYDTKKNLMDLLYRKRNSQSKYQSKYYHSMYLKNSSMRELQMQSKFHELLYSF